MVAYNFMHKYADLIVDGTKTCTIRNPGKRNPKIGERLQLYTGQRTQNCKKLLTPDPICIAVAPIEIDSSDRVSVGAHDLLRPRDMKIIHRKTRQHHPFRDPLWKLIKRDGFGDDMDAFFKFHLKDATREDVPEWHCPRLIARKVLIIWAQIDA